MYRIITLGSFHNILINTKSSINLGFFLSRSNQNGSINLNLQKYVLFKQERSEQHEYLNNRSIKLNIFTIHIMNKF